MKTEAVSAFVYQLSTMAYFFIFMFFFLTSSTLHTFFVQSPSSPKNMTTLMNFCNLCV